MEEFKRDACISGFVITICIIRKYGRQLMQKECHVEGPSLAMANYLLLRSLCIRKSIRRLKVTPGYGTRLQLHA